MTDIGVQTFAEWSNIHRKVTEVCDVIDSACSDSQLNSTEVRLLCVLLCDMYRKEESPDKTPEFQYYTAMGLARRISMSRGSVVLAINHLEQLQYITIEMRSRRTWIRVNTNYKHNNEEGN
jgi:DNA-binding MarR family transcriptional regulator